MDFKSMLNKLDSMEAPEVTPKAPTLPAAVQLNEDAQLRVLSGTSTILAEAKKKDEDDKKADDKKKADKKDEKVKEGFPTVAGAREKAEKEKTTGKFDKKDTSTGTVYTRKASTFTDGGDDKDVKAAKKKAKQDESVDSAFKSRFMQMVEAKKDESDADAKKKKEDKKKKIAKIVDEGSKPDFLDIDGDGDKKEPMKKAAADKKAGGSNDKGGDKETKGLSAKQKNLPAGLQKAIAKKKTDEGVSMGGAGLRIPADTNKLSIGQQMARDGITHSGNEQEMIGKIAKYMKDRGDSPRHIRYYMNDDDFIGDALSDLRNASNNGVAEGKMPLRGKKKTVKESVEQKMSFRDMMKLVVESGGQQQIDPRDQELFAWATRVARNKLGEGMRAEVYAGMVYERMGGVFEMYDVLSEDFK